jgi:hypothetical protein
MQSQRITGGGLLGRLRLNLRLGMTFQEAWRIIEPIEGWLVSPNQEQWLFQVVRKMPRMANIVEIGSFMGRSTISMALGCLGSGRRVFAVDTFQGNAGDFVKGQHGVEWTGDVFFDQFMANVEQSGVCDYVVPLMGISQEVGRFWKAPIHCLFVDGSHEFEDIQADLACFYPHVVAGGIVALHDVTPDWPGPYRIWNEKIRPQLIRTGSVGSLAYGTRP